MQPYYQVDIPLIEQSESSTLTVPPRSFFRSRDRSHRNIISANKKFTCNKCGRTYAFVQSLNRHRKWECGKKPGFRCIYCLYTSKQRNHVKEHILRRHPGKTVHVLNLVQE